MTSKLLDLKSNGPDRTSTILVLGSIFRNDSLPNENAYSLRVDIFPAHFYEKHCSIIGKSVTDAILNCLNFGCDLNLINIIRLILIPKIKGLEDFSQFHPISVCIVLYKIVAKVLANRLKHILPKIIAINQSSFVPNRQIMDNVLVAYELLHAPKKKKKSIEIALWPLN